MCLFTIISINYTRNWWVQGKNCNSFIMNLPGTNVFVDRAALWRFTSALNKIRETCASHYQLKHIIQLSFLKSYTHPSPLVIHLKTKSQNLCVQSSTSSCDGTSIGKTSRHLFMLNEEHKGVSLRYTNYRLTSPIKSTIRSHSELRNHSFSTEDFEILDSF